MKLDLEALRRELDGFESPYWKPQVFALIDELAETRRQLGNLKAFLSRKNTPEEDAFAAAEDAKIAANARAAAIAEFRNVVNPNYKLNDDGDLGKKQRQRLNAALDQMGTLPPSVVCVPVDLLKQLDEFAAQGHEFNTREEHADDCRLCAALAALTKVTR